MFQDDVYEDVELCRTEKVTLRHVHSNESNVLSTLALYANSVRKKKVLHILGGLRGETYVAER